MGQGASAPGTLPHVAGQGDDVRAHARHVATVSHGHQAHWSYADDAASPCKHRVSSLHGGHMQRRVQSPRWRWIRGVARIALRAASRYDGRMAAEVGLSSELSAPRSASAQRLALERPTEPRPGWKRAAWGERDLRHRMVIDQFILFHGPNKKPRVRW
jgi:hypothetical protein